MRGLLRGGGVLLVAATLFLAGRSWSETKAPPRPRTRIGLVNLTYVIKHYDRFTEFQKDLKERIQVFQEKDVEHQKQTVTLKKKEMETPGLSAEQRTALEKKLRTAQRAIEDNKSEAQAFMARRQETQLKLLHEDIQEATRRYAAANDLELVMPYHDAPEESERNSPANIARKMQNAGGVPLFATPGIDISKELTAALNEAARRRKGV